MAINDILKVDVVQTWGDGGEEMSNSFFYRIKDELGTASDLALTFNAASNMVSKINAFQASQVKNKKITVTNLFSLTDFAALTITGVGGTGADPLPIFNAVNMSLLLNTRGVRPGSKRFAGLHEEAQTAGVITFAATITALNNLASLMSDDLVGTTAGALYEHVVVKRVEYTVHPGEPDAHQAYRLPENEGELNYGKVMGVLINMKLSHQVSRGNG